MNQATEEEIQKLMDAANKAKENSYSPYSHFRVGAAILCKDGTIVSGCNVENASYGIAQCAERCAICNAVSQGHRDFKTILVVSDITNDYITPCGACRQGIVEWGNVEVILTKGSEYQRKRIADLLPMAFTPADLTK